MTLWFKKIADEIEAVVIQESDGMNRKPIAEGEEILGTLTPELQKFCCYVERRAESLSKLTQSLNTLPEIDQKNRVRECVRLSAEVEILYSVFANSVMDFLIEAVPNLYDETRHCYVRNGWVVVGTKPPKNLHGSLFVIQDAGDLFEIPNDPEEYFPGTRDLDDMPPQKPTDRKRRLN